MDNCIFCKIVQGEITSWKVFEDEHTYAFFDINPKNEYHTLVIPKKHYTDMFDLPEGEALSLMKTIKKIITLYSEKLGLTDVQIMNNSGKNAQQDVFHIHFHIVPRYKDDGQNCKWPPALTNINERFADLLAKISP